MKAFIVLFGGFAVILATVHAFPADGQQRYNPERDVEEIPMGSYPMQPPSGMDGFLGGFNDMFERMRQQMLELLSIVPRIGQGNTDGGNTTSVTKIIDGHKVVINETVYRSGNGEDTAAVFKVRVVDIHPSDSNASEEEEEEEEAKQPSRSVESVENNHANEIFNYQQKRKVNSMEMLDNYDGLESFGYPNENTEEWSNNDIETFDDDDDDDDDNVNTGAIDLSNDIYVNEIAAAAGKAYQHPDAEAISFEGLSRDTYVNEIAARDNWPRNPYAEFINHQHQNKPEAIQDDISFRPIHSNINRRAMQQQQQQQQQYINGLPTAAGRQALIKRDPYYYNIDYS